MKNLRLFLASLALTCCGLFPAVTLADDMDELDVTMDVLDSVAGIDGNVLIMSGPEGFVAEGPDGEDGGEFDDDVDRDRDDGDENEGELRSESDGESDNERGEEQVDGFGDDGDFLGENDDEDELAHDEGDFDDGEAIDDDEIEEVEMEDDEIEDDDVAANEDGDASNDGDV
jgi:hypothetical protein